MIRLSSLLSITHIYPSFFSFYFSSFPSFLTHVPSLSFLSLLFSSLLFPSPCLSRTAPSVREREAESEMQRLRESDAVKKKKNMGSGHGSF
jgi:hypothetical protein